MAWSMLYRLVGELCSKVELELADTGPDDVKAEYYGPASVNSFDSRGVRVRVTKVLDT